MKRTSLILDWYKCNARKAKLYAAIEHEREECAIILVDIAMLHPDKQCRDALRIGAYAILERGRDA